MSNVSTYVGVFLDGNSKGLLQKLRTFVPEDWVWYGDHMSIKYIGKMYPEDFPEPYNELALSQKPVKLTVTHVGISDEAIAVKVEGYPVEGQIPHITLATPMGGSPRASKNITNWKKIKPFTLHGTIAANGDMGDVISEEDVVSDTLVPFTGRREDSLDFTDPNEQAWAAPEMHVKYGGSMTESIIKRLILNEIATQDIKDVVSQPHRGWVTPDGKFINIDTHLKYLESIYSDDYADLEFSDDETYVDRLYTKAFKDGFVRVASDSTFIGGRKGISLSIEGTNHQRIKDVVMAYMPYLKAQPSQLFIVNPNIDYYSFNLPEHQFQLEDFLDTGYYNRRNMTESIIKKLVLQELTTNFPYNQEPPSGGGAEATYDSWTDSDGDRNKEQWDTSRVELREIEYTDITTLPFLDAIEKAGGKVYQVGGAVRDSFMNKTSKDLDIMVSGITPEQLMQALQPYGRANVVGQSFGVIKFKPHGAQEDIDIALARSDKKVGVGHKGIQVFTDPSITVEQDLIRRDFTINAIAKDIHGNIIDPFNGVSDLKNKVIRMVSPAAFAEDPLRMLRAVQFAARFGFTIEPKTLQEIRQHANDIKTISAERILEEFNKMIHKGSPEIGARLLVESGLYKGIFGTDFKGTYDKFPQVKRMSEFIYLLTKDSVPSPASFFKNQLKGDIDTYKELKVFEIELPWDEAEERWLLSKAYNMAPDAIKSFITQDKLRSGSEHPVEKYPRVASKLAVSGDEITQMGVKGQFHGKLNHDLMDLIYHNQLENTHEAIMDYIQKNIEKYKPNTPSIVKEITSQILKNKLWSGIVDARDGTVEEMWTYQEAKDVDWHHSFLISREQQLAINSGDKVYFWMEDNGEPMDMENKLTPEIKRRIKQQVPEMEAKYMNHGTYTSLIQETTQKIQETIKRALTENIVNVIRQTAKEFMEESQCSLEDINRGLCGDFAETVIDRMGGYSDDLFELTSDMFYSDFPEDQDFLKWEGGLIKTNFGGVWSKKMLKLYGTPDIDMHNWHIGIHEWIYYKKRHYDAEAPNGVDYWYQLPFFQRSISDYKSYTSKKIQEITNKILSEKELEELTAYRAGGFNPTIPMFVTTDPEYAKNFGQWRYKDKEIEKNSKMFHKLDVDVGNVFDISDMSKYSKVCVKKIIQRFRNNGIGVSVKEEREIINIAANIRYIDCHYPVWTFFNQIPELREPLLRSGYDSVKFSETIDDKHYYPSYFILRHKTPPQKIQEIPQTTLTENVVRLYRGTRGDEESNIVYFTPSRKYAEWFAKMNKGRMMAADVDTSEFIDLRELGTRTTLAKVIALLERNNINFNNEYLKGLLFTVDTPWRIWQIAPYVLESAPEVKGFIIQENNPEARHLGVVDSYLIKKEVLYETEKTKHIVEQITKKILLEAVVLDVKAKDIPMEKLLPELTIGILSPEGRFIKANDFNAHMTAFRYAAHQTPGFADLPQYQSAPDDYLLRKGWIKITSHPFPNRIIDPTWFIWWDHDLTPIQQKIFDTFTQKYEKPYVKRKGSPDIDQRYDNPSRSYLFESDDKEIDVYDFQDTHAENIVHSPKWKGGVWRYKFENAGDILRELAKYRNTFLDPTYIYEKVNLIANFIPNYIDDDVHPDDQYKTLKIRDVEVLQELRHSYEIQPVITEAQKVALQLIFNLIDGKLSEARKQIDYFQKMKTGSHRETQKNLMKANLYPNQTLPDVQRPRLQEDTDSKVSDSPILLLLIGISGSGKSRWINSLAKGNFIVVSTDEIRKELTGDATNQDRNEEVFALADKRIEDAISKDISVIVDQTNVDTQYRRPFIQKMKAKFPSLDIRYKLFDAKPEISKQRIKADVESGKDRSIVPDEIVDQQYALYQQTLKDIGDEDMQPLEELMTYRAGERKPAPFYVAADKKYAEDFGNWYGIEGFHNIEVEPGHVLDLTDGYNQQINTDEVIDMFVKKGVKFTEEEIENIRKNSERLDGRPLYTHIVNNDDYANAAKRSGFDSIKQLETCMGSQSRKPCVSYFILRHNEPPQKIDETTVRATQGDVERLEGALLNYYEESDIRNAAYITPNGYLISMVPRDGNSRDDHRAIGSLINDLKLDMGRYAGKEWKYSDTKWLYIALEMGFICIIPESSAIEIHIPPTSTQYEKLRNFFEAKNGDVTLDLKSDDDEAHIRFELETPPDWIEEEIRRFFYYGEKPRKWGEEDEDLMEMKTKSIVRKLTTQIIQEHISPKYQYWCDDKHLHADLKDRLNVGKKPNPQQEAEINDSKKLLGYDPHNIPVYAVNGELVRQYIYPDFSLGGNDQAYPNFIPKNEIWIDQDLRDGNRQTTISHESVERHNMHTKHEYYDVGSGHKEHGAHIDALGREHAIRAGKKLPVKLTKHELIKEAMKSKQNKVWRLVVFDMDHTLVDSPMPDFGRAEWKEKTGEEYPHQRSWWSTPESLDTKVFDIKAIAPVFNQMRDEQRRADTMVVVMTNRLDTLEKEVKNVLRKNQINPDMLSMAEYSMQNKGERILDIIKRNPDIKYVAFYDDQETNISAVRDALKGKGITYDLYNCQDGKIRRT